jgi:RimJ/RimL family protein N-acetyltransferase
MPAPAYRIVTERLEIRCWRPEDAAAVRAVIDESLAHLEPWLPWIPDRAQNDEQQAQIIRRFRAAFDRDEDYVYGIFDRNTGTVIGGTGLHLRVGPKAAEIGFWIRHDRTGAGLAFEAAAALTRVGIEIHDWSRMQIHCDPENRPSARVAEKLGYRYEATLRRTAQIGGCFRDTMIFTLLPEELAGSPAASVELEAYGVLGEQLA